MALEAHEAATVRLQLEQLAQQHGDALGEVWREVVVPAVVERCDAAPSSPVASPPSAGSRRAGTAMADAPRRGYVSAGTGGPPPPPR